MGERLLLWTLILLPGCWALQGPAEVSGVLGGSVEVPCKYEPKLVDANKYWCKGSRWYFCSTLVQTLAPGKEVWGDRVSLRDAPAERLFVVTMKNLTVEDGDQYWCGIQVTGYDPMFLVTVSVLPVPKTTRYSPHTTQGEEATSDPTLPWTPSTPPVLENTVSIPEVSSLPTHTQNLLVSVLTLSTTLLGIMMIIRHRMRKASLEKSRGAWIMKEKGDKDLQAPSVGGRLGQGSADGSTALNTPQPPKVPASHEQADTSSNIYMNCQQELCSPEEHYKNIPAKCQDFEKGDKVLVPRAAERIYMNTLTFSARKPHVQ